jgi:hypothetical protein
MAKAVLSQDALLPACQGGSISWVQGQVPFVFYKLSANVEMCPCLGLTLHPADEESAVQLVEDGAALVAIFVSPIQRFQVGS